MLRGKSAFTLSRQVKRKSAKISRRVIKREHYFRLAKDFGHVRAWLNPHQSLKRAIHKACTLRVQKVLGEGGTCSASPRRLISPARSAGGRLVPASSRITIQLRDRAGRAPGSRRFRESSPDAPARRGVRWRGQGIIERRSALIYRLCGC